MKLCRVDGKAISHACHPSLAGRAMLLCQPINGDGDPVGHPMVAVDHLGAGLHARVFVSSDGRCCRQELHDPKSPIRNFIQGLVDD
jgi:microcompartment protein CcmK/EutM